MTGLHVPYLSPQPRNNMDLLSVTQKDLRNDLVLTHSISDLAHPWLFKVLRPSLQDGYWMNTDPPGGQTGPSMVNHCSPSIV